ncbi:MFS transporter, partial [Francisella tularensis subsp. holarctica]|nr:MFS transporter [Francisella tularensis subsp. holarctica]
DIAIIAYQPEVLLVHESALGNAVAVVGSRIGMLVTGSLVLSIVDKLNNNWNLAWLLILPLFIICPLSTWLIKESQYQDAPNSVTVA